MMSPTKQQISKTFQFFFLNWNYKTFRISWVFEQLSCSIGWQVNGLQPIWPRLPFAQLDFSS